MEIPQSDTPTPSKRLDDLPGYGKGRAAGSAIFSHSLGSNEAPDAVDPAIMAAVSAALSGDNRYPDLRGETLSSALALRHALSAEHIAVAAGSIVLLDQIMRGWCDPGDAVLIPWRSYEAYPIIAGLSGASLVTVPLDAEHRLDRASLLAAIDAHTRIVVICNPNNPTGTALDADEIDALIADIPSRVLIVLDEAYCDYSGSAAQVAASPSERLALHPNVVILRTFSKAWGLAGLRIGYAIAAPSIIATIHAIQPPFPIPGIVLAAAIAALDLEPAVTARIASNAIERERLIEGITAQGLPIAASQANFVWLPLCDDAASLNNHFARSGIATRCFPGEGLRITTGTPADTDAVLNAVARWRPNC